MSSVSLWFLGLGVMPAIGEKDVIFLFQLPSQISLGSVNPSGREEIPCPLPAHAVAVFLTAVSRGKKKTQCEGAQKSM